MREEKSPIDGRLPPLNSLRVFEAVARLESVSRAADELHVTHGAVSRQVRQLEMLLGVALFERRNRAVFRTSQADVLLEACASALVTLGDAVRLIRAPMGASPLVVSCEPTLAMRWLIPRLPKFRHQFPGQDLHLLAAGGPVDFARDRVDVALRRNDFRCDDPCHVVEVAKERVGPVCAPDVARDLRRGGGVTLLHARTRPQAWARWRQSAVETTVKEEGASHFEHFYLSLQAAAAGLGVAIGSAWMVADDLRDGHLVAPFGFVEDGSAYVLLSKAPFDGDRRRADFLAWVRDEMAGGSSDNAACPPQLKEP